MKINTGCLVNGCKCFNPNDEDGVWIKKDRDWVGLTNEDKKQIAMEANNKSEMTAWEYAQRVGELTEAKLKEKNA